MSKRRSQGEVSETLPSTNREATSAGERSGCCTAASGRHSHHALTLVAGAARTAG
jgi:hypothetical protein